MQPGNLKYSTCLHIKLVFKATVCTLMDLSHGPCAPNVWLALKKYFTKRANALQFLSQGGFYYVVGIHQRSPRSKKSN